MKHKKTVKDNYKLLGPIFYRFLFKIYLAQSLYDSQNTIVLFLSRGGIRLRYYYELFLQANNLKSAITYYDFYVSRMSLLKAIFVVRFDDVYKDFLKEYNWYKIEDAIKAFFGNKAYCEWKEKTKIVDPKELLCQGNLNKLIWSDTDSSSFLRSVIDKQYKLYQRYLDQTIEKKESVIVVDTGWSGSILNYMQELDLKREYTAMYFGRYNYGKRTCPQWFNKIIGIEAEDFDFDNRNPVTSIFLNRHLVEGLCEIRCESVEAYKENKKGIIEPINSFPDTNYIAPLPSEEQAYGIMMYIKDAKSGIDLRRIHETAETATKVLCRRLMYPNRYDLKCFSVETRSADFGKDLDVPIFSPKVKRFFDIKGKIRNVINSLWPTGQITIEFPFIFKIVQYFYHRRGLMIKFYHKYKRLLHGTF